jgi:L-alanine-DL-glutamate epimerase-like enolase superfamily enzyme
MIADDAAEGFYIKISKNGGLTKSRRHRDIGISAGYTMSCQETTGSDIAFAAIVHLGQTIPGRYLRCILECRDMITGKTVDGNFEVKNGRVHAPTERGLGITPRLDVLGEAVASYS